MLPLLSKVFGVPANLLCVFARLRVCVFECFAIVPSLLSITSLSKQNRIQTCCLASRQSLQGAHCEQACVCVWIHLSVELCSVKP